MRHLHQADLREEYINQLIPTANPILPRQTEALRTLGRRQDHPGRFDEDRLLLQLLQTQQEVAASAASAAKNVGVQLSKQGLEMDPLDVNVLLCFIPGIISIKGAVVLL